MFYEDDDDDDVCVCACVFAYVRVYLCVCVCVCVNGILDVWLFSSQYTYGVYFNFMSGFLLFQSNIQMAKK